MNKESVGIEEDVVRLMRREVECLLREGRVEKKKEVVKGGFEVGVVGGEEKGVGVLHIL